MTHESAARQRKSHILAELLHKHGISGDKARLMNAEDWSAVALCASVVTGERVHPPHSEATRQAVYELLDAKARRCPISIEEWKLAKEAIQ